jgi:hypothetical protein
MVATPATVTICKVDLQSTGEQDSLRLQLRNLPQRLSNLIGNFRTRKKVDGFNASRFYVRRELPLL